MKNSNDSIGNRTRDLPTCSAVPQPTVPPSDPKLEELSYTIEKAREVWETFKINSKPTFKTSGYRNGFVTRRP
jgi:hypothetical protein